MRAVLGFLVSVLWYLAWPIFRPAVRDDLWLSEHISANFETGQRFGE